MSFAPDTEMPDPPDVVRRYAPELHGWLTRMLFLTWRVWFPRQRPLIEALDDRTQDPFTQYVAVAPATAARNTIAPADDFPVLTVNGVSGQSENIQEWNNYGPGPGAYIAASSKGVFYGVDGSGQKATGFADATLATDLTTYQQLPLRYATDVVPAGNTVASTASETAFTSSYTVPANALAVGRALRLTLTGLYSTALTPPTLRLRIKLGSVVVADSGTILTLVGSLTNGGWQASLVLTVADVGSEGHVESQGEARLTTAMTTALDIMMPNTDTKKVDTTGTLAITVTVQWGTSSASNSITLRQMVVELLR